jgi:hypothetical protein
VGLQGCAVYYTQQGGIFVPISPYITLQQILSSQAVQDRNDCHRVLIRATCKHFSQHNARYLPIRHLIIVHEIHCPICSLCSYLQGHIFRLPPSKHYIPPRPLLFTDVLLWPESLGHHLVQSRSGGILGSNLRQSETCCESSYFAILSWQEYQIARMNLARE